MKSSNQANQAKDLAAAVFTSLKGLVSKWNREPSDQTDERIVVNSLYSGRRKRRQNTGPDHF